MILLLHKDPVIFIFYIILAIFSVCFHEFAHAFVALKQGDETAKKMGMLTINPFKQMGVASIICLLLFGVCWGSCPVDKYRLKNSYSSAMVAIAGPMSNFLLAVIFSICYLVTFITLKYTDISVLHFLKEIFIMAIFFNVFLGAFNLIPLAPLDGHEFFSYVKTVTTRFFKYNKFDVRSWWNNFSFNLYYAVRKNIRSFKSLVFNKPNLNIEK